MNKLQIGSEVETLDGKYFEIVHIYENDVLTPGKNDLVEVAINKGEILVIDKQTKNLKIIESSEIKNN